MTQDELLLLSLRISEIKDLDPSGKMLLQVLCFVREFMDNEGTEHLTWDSIRTRIAEAERTHGIRPSRWKRRLVEASTIDATPLA